MPGFFGKLAPHARVIFAAMALALLATCAKTVKQDSATGDDGRDKGAKELRLENNEGYVRGVVTYPGGDRVDWKFVEIPADTVGLLDVKLTWTSPRPRLQLGFDVYDIYGKRLEHKKGKKNSGKRRLTGKVEGARGKLLIRVYASERGDAATYKLAVEFSPTVQFDASNLEIPGAPRLPAVPDAPIPCSPTQFDQKNPACASVCPVPFDASWPACSGKCPAVPDINNAACHATMPCPNPPDRRVKACPKTLWPECDWSRPDPMNPNCDVRPPAKPVTGRVINVQQESDGVVVTINRGSNKGIERGWKGRLVSSNGRTVEGSSFLVRSVSKDKCYGKISGLQTDTINANSNAEILPP